MVLPAVLKIRGFSVPGLAAVALFAASPSRPSISAADSVAIVSVTPDSAERGVRTTFTVVIDVDLESLDSGVVQAGFNDAEARRFRMVGTQTLTHGRRRLSLTLHSVPVDWGADAPFTLLANVGPPPTPPRWSATAATRRAIPLK